MLDDIQLVALLVTLIVMFALKGEVILQRPELIWLMVPPLVLFFFVLFFGVLMVSRKIGFCYADSATTAFHCTGRNLSWLSPSHSPRLPRARWSVSRP